MKKIFFLLLLFSLISYAQNSPTYEKTFVNIVRSDSIGVARSTCAGYGENNPHPIWYNIDPEHTYEFSMPNASDYFIFFNLYNILTFKQDPQVIPCSNSDFDRDDIEFALLDINDNVLWSYRVNPNFGGPAYSFRLYGIQANEKFKFRVKIDDEDWGIGWYELQIKATDFLNPNERNALFALYNSTNGPNWSNKWDLNKSSASWEGVERTCTIPGCTSDDFSNGFFDLSVWGLYLFNNNLDGNIPSSIGNLSGLLDLEFGNNKLNGQLPTEFSNLNKLRTINLSHNAISGTIPDLTNITNLNLLWLNNNSFGFEDFNNNFDYYFSNVQNFQYTPQSTFDVPLTQTYAPGSRIVLSINQGNGNKIIKVKKSKTEEFQWLKNNIPIDGANTNEYIIENAEPIDSGNYHCEITDLSIPDMKIIRATTTIIIDSSLSVDEYLGNSINIYPNPVKEKLTISTNNSFNFEIISFYNFLGKKVKIIKKSFDNIEINDLINGVYFLKIKTNKGFASKKIIIDR